MIVTNETPLGVGCALGRDEDCTGTAFDPDTSQHLSCACCDAEHGRSVVIQAAELARLHRQIHDLLTESTHWRDVAAAYQQAAYQRH